MSNISDIKGFIKTLPDIYQVSYNKLSTENYINSIKQSNSEFYLVRYTHGATISVGAYSGGIYSPTEDRIYLVPFAQSSVSQWHFVDCKTGLIVPYFHLMGVLPTNAYIGGAYSPKQNRIYFAPRDISTASDWHYVDCNLGTIVAYTHGQTMNASAYVGACYSPTQNRIYFAPLGQSSALQWHFVDCNVAGPTGMVFPYTHGTGVATDLSIGAVYSPSENRIYYIPFAAIANIYYMNCATANMGFITNPAFGAGDYLSGTYSPMQNRIYLNPSNAAPNSAWHFIDCNSGSVVSYANGLTGGDVGVANGYFGGVFDPTTNKIFFVPSNQATSTVWHFINCEGEGSVGKYTGNVSANFSYSGGCYSPKQNKIYFIPREILGTLWYFIKPLTNSMVNETLMAGAMFNKL